MGEAIDSDEIRALIAELDELFGKRRASNTSMMRFLAGFDRTAFFQSLKHS